MKEPLKSGYRHAECRNLEDEDGSNCMEKMKTVKPMHPCTKDCEKRAPGCAAGCQKWAAYEAQRNAYYDERVKIRNANYTDVGMMRRIRRVERAKKRRFFK